MLLLKNLRCAEHDGLRCWLSFSSYQPQLNDAAASTALRALQLVLPLHFPQSFENGRWLDFLDLNWHVGLWLLLLLGLVVNIVLSFSILIVLYPRHLPGEVVQVLQRYLQLLWCLPHLGLLVGLRCLLL